MADILRYSKFHVPGEKMPERFKQVTTSEYRLQRFAIKLRFFINVLNNKTTFLLNLAEFPLILANSALLTSQDYIQL